MGVRGFCDTVAGQGECEERVNVARPSEVGVATVRLYTRREMNCRGPMVMMEVGRLCLFPA